MRYRIEVRAKRGDQESYHYVEHPSVKPGKAQRLVDQTAVAIARHERRMAISEVRFDWHETSGEDVTPASVYVGSCEFHVMATPIRWNEV